MHGKAGTLRKRDLHIYDRLGGMVDSLFLTVRRIINLLRPVSKTGRETCGRRVLVL